jgi:hypothetical protein
MRHSLSRGPLNKNDHVDFWYVQDLEAGRRLLLRAEMKLPGRAWLEFLLSPQARGRTLVRCCAWFEPRGLSGELYWWVLYPVHILIFRGMVQAVCRKAARAMQAVRQRCAEYGVGLPDLPARVRVPRTLCALGVCAQAGGPGRG